MNKKLIVILGPTASGKSDLAIKLAKKFNGEIISADSRQIYKEMIIGTASPCQQIQNAKCKMQKQTSRFAPGNSFGIKDNSKYKIKRIQKPILINKIPHYLLHIIYPNEKFNVAIYKKIAVKTIKDVQKRGKLPFLVGGTGLYISSIVDNLKIPRIPAQKKLRKFLEKKSTQQLFKIYQKLDPQGAKFIEKYNPRRLIRAIEVSKVLKKPFSKQRKKGKPIFDILQIGINLSKKELEKRINKRVEKMFKNGLEKEVEKLIQKYGWKIPAMQTIGYQEWSPFVKTSKDKKRPFFYFTENDQKNIKQSIILHTKQLAKRQITWFKRDKKIHQLKNYKEAPKKSLRDLTGQAEKLINKKLRK